MEEGEGSSEMDYTAIETTTNSLDNSIIFHVVKDVLGFVLYMHQQIPSILQDISLEFETLQTEYKELDTALTQAEVKPSFRRKQNGRMREVKSSIRRLDKLMKTISGLEMALQLLITEISVEGVILVLGASPIRPHYVYQLCFSHGHNVQRGGGFVKSRVAEALSRKIVPFILLLKCRSQDPEIDATEYGSDNSNTISLRYSSSDDFICYGGLNFSTNMLLNESTLCSLKLLITAVLKTLMCFQSLNFLSLNSVDDQSDVFKMSFDWGEHT